MKNSWDPVLKQYDQEISSWNRLLDFLSAESAHLKVRVQTALDDHPDHKAVQWLETFQEEWLAWEQAQEHVMDELRQQVQRRGRNPYKDAGELLKELQVHQEALQVHIRVHQMEFLEQKEKLDHWMNRHFVPQLLSSPDAVL